MTGSAAVRPAPRLMRPVSAAQVREVLRSFDTALDIEKLRDDTLFRDAGADSLDFFNIIAGIQEAGDLNIPDNDLEQVSSIHGLVNYLNARLP